MWRLTPVYRTYKLYGQTVTRELFKLLLNLRLRYCDVVWWRNEVPTALAPRTISTVKCNVLAKVGVKSDSCGTYMQIKYLVILMWIYNETMKEKLCSYRFNKFPGNYCYGRLYVRTYHVEHKLMMQSDVVLYYMLTYKEMRITFILL